MQVEQQVQKVNRRTRAEFESAMAIVRMLVDEAPDRETGVYLLRGLKSQCRILSEKFDLRVEIQS